MISIYCVSVDYNQDAVEDVSDFSEENHQFMEDNTPTSATTKSVKYEIPVDVDSKTTRDFIGITKPRVHLLGIPLRVLDSIFQAHPEYASDGFDFPVGKPDAQGYFKAQNFGDRLHLGEDWNGISGGNTDLGDPVYSVANGLVVFTEDVCCGWGNVVRVIHRLKNHQEFDYVESVYAHLQNYNVNVGEFVHRGENIAKIGNAKGRYSAHLHLEIRSFINMALGPGYSDDTFGYLDPSPFIRQNRPY